MTLDPARLVEMYTALVGGRVAEQAITDLAERGESPPHHSGLGHESVGVGVGFAVRADDCVQASHRSGMMLALARGGYSLREAVLSQFGLAPGPRTQVEGHPRTLNTVGLVGSQIPMAVGVAMADKLDGRDSVTVAFIGDGGANAGAVHEAMNLAGARRIPVVFVVENNGLAVSTPTRDATAADSFAARGAGYGMPAVVVDGNDSLAVHNAAAEAVSRARRGEGPSLIEARVGRWAPHATGVADLRSATEMEELRDDDCVRRLRDALVADAIATTEQLDDIDSACQREVDSAIDEARHANRPAFEAPVELSDDDAWRLTYSSGELITSRS